jgi:hypothetical protein
VSTAPGGKRMDVATCGITERGRQALRRVIKGRGLDVLLALVAIVSATAVLLSHEDPFVRIAACNYTGLCSTFAHAKAWYKVIYDLGIGALVSLAFYFLVVRLPEYQRRQRLKRSLELHYRAFRLNCIEIMLSVADRGLREDSPKPSWTRQNLENISSKR